MVWALVLVPLVAGLLLYAVPRSAEMTAKWIGVAISSGAFVVAAFGYGTPDETVRWLQRPFVANFHVGLNGPGYWIVLLLTLTTGCALMVTRLPRTRDFVAQMLLLLGAMTGVFVARDLLVFALFWDLMLIPVFLVLVAWSPSKSSATAWKYLIYNLSGGLALLLATAAYGILAGSTDAIDAGAPLALPGVASFWIFAGFAIAFAIKTPVWPFHTWAPDTYAELPAPMAAVVSAVQSKAGLYGFLVIGAGLLRGPMQQAATLAIVLGLISLVYGGLAALADDDSKRVVAYSSLSHLGLILLAVFSFDPIAYGGALVYIVAHGLFSAGLFMTIGEVELREDTPADFAARRARRAEPAAGGRDDDRRACGARATGALRLCGRDSHLDGALSCRAHLGGDHCARSGRARCRVQCCVFFQGMMHGPEVDDLPQRGGYVAARDPGARAARHRDRFARCGSRAGNGSSGVARARPRVAGECGRRSERGHGHPAARCRRSASFWKTPVTPQLLIPFGNADWAAVAPLTIVALSALVVILADLTLPRTLRRPAGIAIGIAGLAVAGIVALGGWGHPYSAFGGGFVRGGFAIVLRRDRRHRRDLFAVARLHARPRRSGGRGYRAHAVERERRDADGGRLEFDDDFSRLGITFACALLFVRGRAARRRPRSGAQVPYFIVDGVGVFIVRSLSALRGDGFGRAFGARRAEYFERTLRRRLRSVSHRAVLQAEPRTVSRLDA